MTPYMNIRKRHVFMNAYFALQFSYSSLAWMCCLQIIFQQKQLSFEEVLENDDSISVHHRNLQSFVILIYKLRNSLSPIFIQLLFLAKKEHPCYLRHICQFKAPSVNTVFHDTENVSFCMTKNLVNFTR